MATGYQNEDSSLLEWAEAVDLLLQLPPEQRLDFIDHLAGELTLPALSPPPRRWWHIARVEYIARIIGN